MSDRGSPDRSIRTASKDTAGGSETAREKLDREIEQHANGDRAEPAESTVMDRFTREAHERAGNPRDDNTGRLLADLEAFIRRYVVLTDEQVLAVALWVMHTHAIDAAEYTPYLNPRSAEKMSGKTRLLEVLRALVARPRFWGSRPTEAVVFRLIEEEEPTLLLDEVDAIWNGKEEHEGLRAALDSGYGRGATVPRVVGVGTKQHVQEFRVFSAKALAGIGTLPDTIANRSIPIVMKRRRPEQESVERWRPRRDHETRVQAEALKIRCDRWHLVNWEALQTAEPDLPDELEDREQDIAEPLLAIADLTDRGGEARAAFVNILSGTREDHSDSKARRALIDVRRVFETDNLDKIHSSALVRRLQEIKDSDWSDDNYGRGLTQERLAAFLREYGIHTRTVRDEGTVLKGYHRDDLTDAWERWLGVEPPPPIPPHDGLEP